MSDLRLDIDFGTALNENFYNFFLASQRRDVQSCVSLLK